VQLKNLLAGEFTQGSTFEMNERETGPCITSSKSQHAEESQEFRIGQSADIPPALSNTLRLSADNRQLSAACGRVRYEFRRMDP
jgi:hypothetical protein